MLAWPCSLALLKNCLEQKGVLQSDQVLTSWTILIVPPPKNIVGVVVCVSISHLARVDGLI